MECEYRDVIFRKLGHAQAGMRFRHGWHAGKSSLLGLVAAVFPVAGGDFGNIGDFYNPKEVGAVIRNRDRK